MLEQCWLFSTFVLCPASAHQDRGTCQALPEFSFRSDAGSHGSIACYPSPAQWLCCIRLAPQQVEKLYELFKVISSSGDDDGLIDKSEFQQALGLKRNLFVDRMFELFDANGDKNINFTEFVAGLSVFTVRAKAAEKARFSFRMYDFNADGKIDKAELGRMLQATIEENSLNITPEAAQELLDATFVEAECAEAGTMTFDEYQALVTKKPQLLEFMTITSLNQVIS